MLKRLCEIGLRNLGQIAKQPPPPPTDASQIIQFFKQERNSQRTGDNQKQQQQQQQLNQQHQYSDSQMLLVEAFLSQAVGNIIQQAEASNQTKIFDENVVEGLKSQIGKEFKIPSN